MLVIGMDGLDPTLLKRWMDEGLLPNFKKLAESGSFSALGTSMPPQSPVAWSNFIVGNDPGTHQIYDFVHRKTEPKTFVEPWNKENPKAAIELYLSTSEPQPVEKWYSGVVPNNVPVPFTQWNFPLEGVEHVLLRKGPTFWEALVKAGIDTTVYRMPANFPPLAVKGRAFFKCLCGMGTPDINGSYGEFTAFREDMLDDRMRVSGGVLKRIDVRDHRASTHLEGPPSPLDRGRLLAADIQAAPGPASSGTASLFSSWFHSIRESAAPTTCRVEITRDPTDESALIKIDETRVLLRKGEWSGWIPLQLRPNMRGETIVAAVGGPTRIPAMVRVYLRAVHPNLDVYVSPLNIDPSNPAMAVATPSSFSNEIAEMSGLCYTQGIPEDTKALRSDALTEDEFLQMVRLLAVERTKQYQAALEKFNNGFLFFYFGHTDQLAHIFWRDTDPGHTGRKPEQDGKYEHVIRDTYREMDLRLSEALAKIDAADALIVCSDHGFSSFRRGLNVNRWLADEGYLVELPPDQAKQNDADGLTLPYADWSKTRAYAVGINSIYLNLKGRERFGIVEPGETQQLLAEISSKLLALRDKDASDAQVVVKTYVTSSEYKGADPLIAPDLLVGYAHNYRGSWSTVEGKIRRRTIENNIDRWSGDHCIASYLVPGVILSNRKLAIDDPALTDMAATILAHFGAARPEGMGGRNVLRE